MLVPTRHGQSDSYRYGFQGQEKDDEIKGEGNSMNFTYRMNDPRIGRFFAPDPLEPMYAHNSPYSFCENSVIQFVELEGLEKATIKEKRNAFIVINAYEIQENTQTVWTKISKTDFLNALKNMVLYPSSIDQSDSNLCGIAATCKSMVEYDPENFVKGAISLYETGAMGSLSLFHSDIESNSEMFDKKPSNGLNPAEYIVMSSMRNSYNLSLSFDPETDKSGLRGFTYPGDISDIATNFTDMKDVTFNYSNDVKGINSALKDQATVIGLFDIDQLKSGKPSTVFQERNFGSHFIVINSISSSGGVVTLNYWNYGDTSKKQSTITTKQETYDESIKNYTILNSN